MLCLVFFPVFVGPSLAQDQHFITIGTAGVTGVYFPTGGATCKIVNLSRAEHGVRCSVETTLGSISNIRLIRSGELDFGYVQSDWQHHAYFGTSVFLGAEPFEDLRSVFSLHSEVATVVVREGAGFLKFDDLKSAKINIGSQGSGSAASWNALISGLGWTQEDQRNLSNLRTSELAEALCSGKIDAYFELIGHPASLIEETQEQCDIQVLGLDHDVIDSLVREFPYYSGAIIPTELYGLTGPVESLGVVATFITSARMPDDVVYTVVKAVFEYFDSFKRLHPALSRLEVAEMVSHDMPAPLHPGALKFYRDQGLLPAED
ncbi:TAXI family TRAP transporter solute-binding subunit [uncultured Roseibium sp.]|uniref:TAXI family TRAP transporter solute-binding subunit n=1 Tax=uncultured Roseibium sp. TaxID=1936171 RepID=UPI002606FA26|nr:TAXI family TRAP transporter solute-binding subunit [uncultured Roseibium sp.]